MTEGDSQTKRTDCSTKNEPFSGLLVAITDRNIREYRSTVVTTRIEQTGIVIVIFEIAREDAATYLKMVVPFSC